MSGISEEDPVNHHEERTILGLKLPLDLSQIEVHHEIQRVRGGTPSEAAARRSRKRPELALYALHTPDMK